MTDYSPIIAELEKATEPSRRLDCEIFKCAGMPLPSKFLDRGISLQWDAEQDAFVAPIGDMQVRFDWPAYTSSIDAAIALCERMLPGWRNSSIKTGDNEFAAYVWERDSWRDYSADRVLASRAIALLIALFRALAAQEGE